MQKQKQICGVRGRTVSSVLEARGARGHPGGTIAGGRIISGSRRSLAGGRYGLSRSNPGAELHEFLLFRWRRVHTSVFKPEAHCIRQCLLPRERFLLHRHGAAGSGPLSIMVPVPGQLPSGRRVWALTGQKPGASRDAAACAQQHRGGGQPRLGVREVYRDGRTDSLCMGSVGG